MRFLRRRRHSTQHFSTKLALAILIFGGMYGLNRESTLVTNRSKKVYLCGYLFQDFAKAVFPDYISLKLTASTVAKVSTTSLAHSRGLVMSYGLITSLLAEAFAIVLRLIYRWLW
mgnify:CR=1 FL=1